jgi:hypothetical protein
LRVHGWKIARATVPDACIRVHECIPAVRSGEAHAMNQIPERAWTASGLALRNLLDGTLGDAISDPRLLMFLRHLG